MTVQLTESVTSAPADLVGAWTKAYQDYSRLYTLEHRESSPAVREQLGYAAKRIAAVYRDLLAARGFPWWCLAAVELAAAEFEAQAISLGVGEVPNPCGGSADAGRIWRAQR
ncbi:hypothetical protein ACQPXB_38640 [Amycolatopsis sp. CA-161197]|uniref:hypothetical protein n=1 Tax=Amycolatopsis sp. CA-161197 TaxID=3239922 RepID=UPI003D8DB258